MQNNKQVHDTSCQMSKKTNSVDKLTVHGHFYNIKKKLIYYIL